MHFQYLDLLQTINSLILSSICGNFHTSQEVILLEPRTLESFLLILIIIVYIECLWHFMLIFLTDKSYTYYIKIFICYKIQILDFTISSKVW